MKRVGLAMLVLVLALGCSRSGPQADATDCADPRGDTAFPVASLEDWVTYGDHAVSAKAVPSANDGWVDLVPEEMLWSRSGAQPAPPQVRAWSNGDQASPEGIDLLEKHTYLVLLVRRSTTGEDTTWVAMDTLAFDDDVVGQGPKQCWPAATRPARDQLWGLHEADVRRVLTTAQPDSAAAPYADLDPGERYQRVAAERR